jgi:hypothetical protein
MNRKSLKISALAFVGGLLAGTAAAQTPHPEFQDRFSLELGAYFPKADTTAYLNNSAGGTGTSVSFENLLGVEDSKTTGTFTGRMRLGEKWRVELGYTSLDRSGSRAIGQTVSWGDNTYPAGTTVNSNFQSETLRLSAGYSFVKNPNSEFGVALGLHTTQFEASLSAAGIGTAKGDVLAPLPTIGVYGAYAFSPQWLLAGRIDFFSLSYKKYDGTVLDTTVKVDYRFHRNFGVGLGWRYVDYDFTASDGSYKGGIDYRFSGPVLQVTGSF